MSGFAKFGLTLPNRGVVTDFSRRWPTGKRAWQDRCGRFASMQSVRKKRENSDQRPLWANPVDEVGVQKITEREANNRQECVVSGG